ALVEREAINDRKGIGETKLAIGDVQRAMGLPGSAEATYQQALDVFRSLGHRNPEMELLERLAMLQRDAGLHEEAFANIVEHHRIKSELQSEDVRRRLNTAEARRNLEVATKQAEIERLRNIELADANEQLQQAHDRLAIALSELQSTQSQLVHAEKMSSLGQLTAGIAHEINNPINFIHASALPLRRDLDEIRSAVADALAGLPVDYRARVEAELQARSVDELRDEIDALLRGIEDGANRTAVIVQGLRSFSRLDEGEQKHVDLHDGLDATLALLAVRMQGIDVVRDYGELPLVECAPGQINQVFMNILSNAIDALGALRAEAAEALNAGGVITVRTSCVDSRVHVSIADTGCGIEDANLPRIFDPFFTTKPVGKGQGLGLAIAHGIVQRHGGAIEVESVVGDGSTFTVTLAV
ncbi:MAG: hypothetical protein H7X80_07760, partial [bacterium]|nr:hypothetical protein [Candidatus Kapabacteria bacterium]